MIEVHDLRTVPAEQAEAWMEHLTAHMRAQDVEEVEAAGSVSRADAIPVSVGLSSHCYVVLGRSGNPVAAFGVAPHPLPGVGVAWLLGTDELLREAYPVAKATKAYLKVLSGTYDILWNFVDARNSVSIRWLQWGGFSSLGAHPRGPEGRSFHIFARASRD